MYFFTSLGTARTQIFLSIKDTYINKIQVIILCLKDKHDLIYVHERYRT